MPTSFGEDGRPVSRFTQANWPKPAGSRRIYGTAALIARLIILPPLLAILAVCAWLLWSATEDALGEDSVIFLLPVLAMVAIVVIYRARPSFAGSSALLGWCGLAALIWGAVGMLVWTLAGG